MPSKSGYISGNINILFQERDWFFSKALHISWGLNESYTISDWVMNTSTCIQVLCYFTHIYMAVKGVSGSWWYSLALGSLKSPICNIAMDVYIQFQHLLVILLFPWVTLVKVSLWDFWTWSLIFFSAELITTLLLLFLIIF
jgi:hypothetical protein